MQRTTGIGPALREARLSLGKSLEEASRDTKIRPEYLQALERESFSRLQGEVYVRGFLRSYSSYLGLDPERVMGAYMRAVPDRPAPRPAPVKDPVDPAGVKVLRRRNWWPFAIGLAVILLVIFAAIGVLSRSSSQPRAASIPAASSPSPDGIPVYLTASLRALKPVRASVVSDGTRVFMGTLRVGKEVTYTAGAVLRLRLSKGGVVEITINGHELGAPGEPGTPFAASFLPQDYRGGASANGG